ncbi:MAG: hypothetical protein GWP91_04070, partial [Rhodobacterales bacterium]|nr:hypothetical protein [Rhodobacterales bacterium]
MSRAPLFCSLAVLLFGCSEYDLKGDVPPNTVSTTTPAPGTPAPDIEVQPRVLDFGFLPPGCVSETKTVQITNVGEAELSVQDIQLTANTDGAFWMDATPDTLAPGDIIEVLVEFTPPDLLDYGTVGLQVASNDPDEGFVNVDLGGIGAFEAVFTEVFAQNSVVPVDVLWVVDNSGSMSGELNNLSNEFNFFINGFIALGLDYQIGVITTDMDNPAQSGQLMGPIPIISPAGDPIADFAAAIDQGSSGSGDERGLDAAQAALTDPLLSGANAGFVRPGAILSVILVT